MISIIIPAHNEETVIARGLRAILTGAEPGELEVIVACNGCTDRTAEIACAFGPPVRVVEIEQASKVAALNAADEVATGFPRFYIDADVVLDLRSIRAMAVVLERGEALFATPSLAMDLSHSTWSVRTFYRVWTQLPYNRVGGQVGTGVYALSRAGRARFDRFPDVINDDGFARFSFAPHERVTVADAVSHVAPPRTLRTLIRAKTRVRLGRIQLRQRYSDRSASDRTARPLWRWALRHPGLWPLLPVYAAVTLVARRRARRQNETTLVPWGRDDSRSASASTRWAPESFASPGRKVWR